MGIDTKHKSTFKVILLTINCCFGTFYFGYQLAVMNNAGCAIIVYNKPKSSQTKEFCNSSENQWKIGYLTSAVPLGAAIGAYTVSYLMQKLPRRKCLIFADILASLILFLQVIFLENLWVVVILRFLGGAIVGINATLVPLYVSNPPHAPSLSRDLSCRLPCYLLPHSAPHSRPGNYLFPSCLWRSSRILKICYSTELLKREEQAGGGGPCFLADTAKLPH